MGINNLDRKENEKVQMQENISNALKEGDNDSVAKALTEMANGIQDSIIQEARNVVSEDVSDQRVLESRGVRSLTKEETSYYNAVIDGAGFDGVEQLVPKTVFDRVFEDLRQNHALLNAIDFVNTTSVSEWVYKKGDVNTAFWGKLSSNIQELLDDGFQTLQMNQYKLSAFIPVSNAMLSLGPTWLDRYVRAVLAEAIAIALEQAVLSGTGKDQPIGMIKDLAGAVTDGVYPDKTATAISDLSAKTLGTEVMAPLTKGGKRAVTDVLMVVNPVDYWEKVFPETVVLNQNGTYVNTGLPIPATIIQSVAMPQGQMATGLAKDYFAGVGTNRKVESSKDVRFIEDETVYLTKMHANGQPKDNASFLLFDISGVGTATV